MPDKNAKQFIVNMPNFLTTMWDLWFNYSILFYSLLATATKQNPDILYKYKVPNYGRNSALQIVTNMLKDTGNTVAIYFKCEDPVGISLTIEKVTTLYVDVCEHSDSANIEAVYCIGLLNNHLNNEEDLNTVDKVMDGEGNIILTYSPKVKMFKLGYASEGKLYKSIEDALNSKVLGREHLAIPIKKIHLKYENMIEDVDQFVKSLETDI